MPVKRTQSPFDISGYTLVKRTPTPADAHKGSASNMDGVDTAGHGAPASSRGGIDTRSSATSNSRGGVEEAGRSALASSRGGVEEAGRSALASSRGGIDTRSSATSNSRGGIKERTSASNSRGGIDTRSSATDSLVGLDTAGRGAPAGSIVGVDEFASIASNIVGVDEAGCGALAGPVVAAAVVLGTVQIDGLTDSKCISAAKRTHLCGVIMDRVPCYAIASASRAEIDRLNILQARLLAMKRALQALQLPADMHILVDGTHLPDLDRPASAIIKGDLTVPAISAASIVAKVYRDWLMNKLHGRFPHYQFAAHKGYPTRAHRLAIAEHGLCTAHRRSFAPCHQPPPQRPPNSPTSAANTLPEMAVANASPASANPRRPASAKNASPATAKNATRTAGADNTPRAVAVANARPARARARRAGAVTVSGV